MKSNVNSAGVIRLIIYALSVLVSLCSMFAPLFGADDLAQTLTVVASALASVAGTTAIANIGKAPDQPGGGLDLNAAVAAYPVITRAIQDYQKRDVPRETGSTPVTAADDYGRHAAKTTSTGEDIPPLPIYRGESSAS